MKGGEAAEAASGQHGSHAGTDGAEGDFTFAKDNKIAVSNSKTASFFANLTKRFFRSHEEVELSALENAIAVAVDTVEMLKQSKVATLVSVNTSMAQVRDSKSHRLIPKPRMQILVRRTPEFMRLLAELEAEAVERATLEAQGAGGAPTPAAPGTLVR